MKPLENAFQFHKGTIKTPLTGKRLFRNEYFNSIKVRLKQPQAAISHLHALFQFHKGTIKTTSGYYEAANFDISIP